MLFRIFLMANLGSLNALCIILTHEICTIHQVPKIMTISDCVVHFRAVKFSRSDEYLVSHALLG